MVSALHSSTLSKMWSTYIQYIQRRLVSARGYSLTELVVVVAVVGTLAVVGVPAMARYLQTTSAREGARELQAGLNRARSMAIMSRRNVCVQLNANGSGYQFLWDTCAAPAPIPFPTETADGTFILGNNVTIANAVAPPVFTPFGTANPGAVFTVRESAGLTATVTIAASGRVTVP